MAQRSLYYAANDTVAYEETDHVVLLTAAELGSNKTRIWNSVELHDIYILKGGTRCSRKSLMVKLCE